MSKIIAAGQVTIVEDFRAASAHRWPDPRMYPAWPAAYTLVNIWGVDGWQADLRRAAVADDFGDLVPVAETARDVNGEIYPVGVL